VAVTVKVGDETKRSLDHLQAALTLRLGRRPTMQELVEELAKMGLERTDEIARRLGHDARSYSAQDWRSLQARIAAANAVQPDGPDVSREDRDLYDPADDA
jgi:hypothetical protein